FGNAEALFDRNEVRGRLGSDFFDDPMFTGAADEENLRVQFVLEPIADGCESFGWPQAVGATASGMHNDLRTARAASADEASHRGDVLLVQLHVHMPNHDRHAERGEKLVVDVGDV